MLKPDFPCYNDRWREEFIVEMQYVHSIAGSVSKTYNSINPATLSGVIDIIMVESENGMNPAFKAEK